MNNDVMEMEQPDVTAADEKALADLAALESEEAARQAEQGDHDGAAAAAEEAAEEQGYRMGAQMAVGFCEQLIAMRMPYVVIDPAAKVAVVDKLVPVLRKHGGGLPEWLLPYKEELELGMVLAGVGFGVFVQVRAESAARKEAAAKAEAEAAAKSDATSQGVATGRDEFGRELTA